MSKTPFAYFLALLLFLALAPAHAPRAAEGDGLSGYRLGTGDLVRVQVFGEDDLSVESRVSDRGTIPYPLLGELKVVGLSIRGVEELIANRLRGDYLVNPRVSVSILEYRQFYVNGQVKSPGGFPYQPGLTVRQAVSLAGGFTERASRNKIFVVRDKDPAGASKKVELNDPVRPGDTLTVEESFF